MKSLYDISWKVSEEEYREDSALSYSTLARFEREGFNNLDKLFDKVESPSLTFGSAVDSLITGGQKEFDSRFIVIDFPNISDSIIRIVRKVFNIYKDSYQSLEDIPDDNLSIIITEEGYYPNWKPATRLKDIREKGARYYELLYIAGDKSILDTATYQDVCTAVEALKTSNATKYYFKDNDPFDTDTERFYQLKFKAYLNGIEYKCMADLIIVDSKRMTIQPVDLKTSCKKNDREWDFPKHYLEWGYQIQNRLYVRILQDVISKDDYFKDFTLLPYKDIIIFRGSTTPLVWNIPFTFTEGTIILGKHKQIELRDPFDIGEELSYYLSSRPKVPMEINETGSNDLKDWLNKL